MICYLTMGWLIIIRIDVVFKMLGLAGFSLLVLGGVVYISFVVSLMNLLVDILYAVIDPRIKSKMKNY